MKVGIIGLGHMGLLHLRNTRFIEGIQVVAAADKSKKALTEAKTYGVKHLYKDYRELFESVSLDAVVLSLPNFLKSEYDQGTVGDIEIANLEHFTNGPFAHPLEPVPVREWWLNPALTGGGALIDQGYHLIDLFRWFFPEPEVLYVHLGYRYNLDLEDSALLMLRSRRTSTTGIIGVGWFQKMIFPQFNFRINLHGTAGFLSTDHFAPKNLYFHAAKESLKNILFKIAGKRINPLAYTYYYTSYFEELRKFFQRINADDSIDDLPTVDDGMETIRIIEESYKFAGTTNE
jgi:predicted dehydrogenase